MKTKRRVKCQFNNGDKKYSKPPYQCNKWAKFKTTNFKRNFNLCEEHAKIYRDPYWESLNKIEMFI